MSQARCRMENVGSIVLLFRLFILGLVTVLLLVSGCSRSADIYNSTHDASEPTTRVSQSAQVRTLPAPKTQPSFTRLPVDRAFKDVTLYFSFRSDQTEIWITSGDGTKSNAIYELPLQLSLLEAEQLGLIYEEESNAIREYYASGPPAWPPSADEIPLDIVIRSLNLSPAGDILIWVEIFEWPLSGSVTYGQYLLKSMDLESLEVTTLAHSPNVFGYPVWSSDGKKIAFHEVSRSVGGEAPSIWIYDTNTRSLEWLGEGFEPTWSPESTRLAAEQMSAGYPPKYLGVRILSLEGAPPVSVTLEPWNDPWDNPQNLAWSPTQGELAFVVPDENYGQLFVIDLASRDIHLLLEGLGYSGVVEWPVWSPDGRWIATVALTETEHRELVLLNVNDGTLAMEPVDADQFFRNPIKPSIEWSREGLGLLAFIAPSSKELSEDGRTLYTYDSTGINSFIRGQFVIVSVPGGQMIPVPFPEMLEESPAQITGPTSIAW